MVGGTGEHGPTGYRVPVDGGHHGSLEGERRLEGIRQRIDRGFDVGAAPL
jgi:hypothetical protein